MAAINPGLKIAVSQDYMCEEWMLEKTGLTVEDHQRLTIRSYDALLPLIGIYLMPVLQGYSLESYLDQSEQYGDRLRLGAYVGLGSVCKRNADIQQVEATSLPSRRSGPICICTVSASRAPRYSARSCATICIVPKHGVEFRQLGTGRPRRKRLARSACPCPKDQPSERATRMGVSNDRPEQRTTQRQIQAGLRICHERSLAGEAGSGCGKTEIEELRFKLTEQQVKIEAMDAFNKLLEDRLNMAMVTARGRWTSAPNMRLSSTCCANYSRNPRKHWVN